MTSRSPRRFAAVVAILGVALAAAAAGPAAALPPGTVGVFPGYTLSGVVNSISGSFLWPASSGMPATTIVSDASSMVSPSGESAYLGAGTAFGQEFGSTRKQPYITVRPHTSALIPSNSVPSVTTISFASTPAPGWGFALGDIDADYATVEALDAVGTVLPISALGAQTPGNYCDGASPRPSTCGTGPNDVPTWWTGPGTDPNGRAEGTIVGYDPGVAGFRDSDGAYQWFMPDGTVQQIRVTFGVLLGSPTAQLWFAAPAARTDIQGTLTVNGRVPGAIAGTLTAHLGDAAGSPILDIDDQPVTTPVAADGSFVFITEQGDYQVSFTSSDPDITAPSPIAVSATAPVTPLGSIDLADLSPDPEPEPQLPELAYGGSESAALSLGALILLAAGAGILLWSRRRGSVNR